MDYLPTKLNTQINYSRGKCMSIDWNGELLKFDRSDSPQQVLQMEIAPTVTTWHQFWAELEIIEIWSWDARYESATGLQLLCGGNWIVSIEHGNKTIYSQGKDDVCPVRFDRYERAIFELVTSK